MAKPAPADFVTWKARAAADLKRQHNVNPGSQAIDDQRPLADARDQGSP
jgi:hypothetical protein